MLQISKIKGYSMSPSYMEGDYVVSISPKIARLKPGDTIVFDHPVYGFLIKKISEATSGGYFVKGTHPASTGTASIGLVSHGMIKGKVIHRIKNK